MIDASNALTYITRQEMADILKCSLANINTMVHDGRLNLPELRITRLNYRSGVKLSIYPRAMFMELVEKGVSIRKLSGVREYVEYGRGITFKQVLSGAFSSQHEKDRHVLKRVHARTGKPKTTTVRIRAASL